MAQKTFHFLFISTFIYLNYFFEYEKKLTFVSLSLIIYILIFRNIFFNNEIYHQEIIKKLPANI